MTRDDLDRIETLEPQQLTREELQQLVRLARDGLRRQRDRRAVFEASLLGRPRSYRKNS